MCLQQPTLWVCHTVIYNVYRWRDVGYTYWTSHGLCFNRACLTWRRSTYQKHCNFLMCTTKNGVLCLYHNFHKDTEADEVLWHTLQGERGCGGREGGRKRGAEEEEVILQPHPSSLLLLRQKGEVVMLIDLFLNCWCVRVVSVIVDGIQIAWVLTVDERRWEEGVLWSQGYASSFFHERQKLSIIRLKIMFLSVRFECVVSAMANQILCW